MYRVAVIQNERELLRAGYVNFTPHLKHVTALARYAFSIFDTTNIKDLFADGPNCLEHFESLFIATNATSESTVLEALQGAKDRIAAFTASGRGIFVGSQKKLSYSDDETPSEHTGTTGFLPAQFEFKTVERPKAERDSGLGSISEAPDLALGGNGDVLLRFPNDVTAQRTQEICEVNSFKRHVYRSYLRPRESGSYEPVFRDSSYSPGPPRNLLMVNKGQQGRVVISTIVLDWELHELLLVNILKYITEGLPTVAFIGKGDSAVGDYRYVVSSAQLAKISHVIYDDAAEIDGRLAAVHTTYVFAPGCDENEILDFWDKVDDAGSRPESRRPPYRRLYYFRSNGGKFGLTRYSNFSSIDLIIDNGISWVEQQFTRGMWAGSFWITYDILIMMSELNVRIGRFIPSVISDIQGHDIEGSYDGVMGATCGLLELLLMIRSSNARELRDAGVTDERIEATLNWIFDNFSKFSIYDKQTAALTLTRLNLSSERLERHSELPYIVDHIRSIRQNFSAETELDICRKIAVLILCYENTEAISLLVELKQMQSSDGMWVSTKRTAFVLLFLLQSVLPWCPPQEKGRIDEMIFSGVNFLRSQYDDKVRNWGQDLQITAKALHAIGLYNRLYGYSTQDFFERIRLENGPSKLSVVL
ncbi:MULTISPECIES: hypothetical protein [unclassified Bradyrhizobium]|uniref:hypothetical protein n=1 Tax=unclassified Bradyrhizobium TaxID=2631580 RepID=UPI0029169553|nr:MULTISPECIES: hypothetical protein [unclassified Bradyrhizobium]